MLTTKTNAVYFECWGENYRAVLVGGEVGVCEDRPFGLRGVDGEDSDLWSLTDIKTGLSMAAASTREELLAKAPEVTAHFKAKGMFAPSVARGEQSVRDALWTLQDSDLLSKDEVTRFLTSGMMPFTASACRLANGFDGGRFKAGALKDVQFKPLGERFWRDIFKREFDEKYQEIR